MPSPAVTPVARLVSIRAGAAVNVIVSVPPAPSSTLLAASPAIVSPWGDPVTFSTAASVSFPWPVTDAARRSAVIGSVEDW